MLFSKKIPVCDGLPGNGGIMSPQATLVAILMLMLGPTPASKADWPAWRGPSGDGITRNGKLNFARPMPETAWTHNAGRGYSALTIAGGLVFTMGNADNHDTVFALDEAAGAEKWKHRYACGAGSYPGPRATPVVHGGRVYTVSRDGLVLCLDASKGSVLWSVSLQQREGARLPTWGIAGSPVVDGDRLLINAGAAGIALDVKTGRTVWNGGPGAGGYAAPVVFDAGEIRAAAIFAREALIAVDARTGRRLWEFPWKTRHDVNAADPLYWEGRLFISSGYGKGCAMLDIRGGAPRVVWRNNRICAQFSSPVRVGNLIFGVDGNAGRGDLVCLDWNDGSERWRRNTGFGSLIVVDNRIILLNENGTVYVVDATGEAYRERARFEKVLSRTCWTAPTSANGRLFLRNDRGRVVVLDFR